MLFVEAKFTIPSENKRSFPGVRKYVYESLSYIKLCIR